MKPLKTKAPYVRLRVEKGSGSPIVTRLDIIDAVLRESSSGRLPAGLRLPPVRLLHHQLGVSKNTVCAAYDELVARGIVENRKRLGYFMLAPTKRRSNTPTLLATDLIVNESAPFPTTRSKLSKNREVIPLGSVFIDKELLPVARITECIRASLKSPGLRYMHDPQGFEPLRRRIASRLEKRGIPAHADDVIITTGSQQALDIAVRAMKRRCIATENPTYAIAKKLFELQQMEVVGLPFNPFTGIDMEDWRQQIAARRPGALYLVTNFQNPTGYSTQRPN